MINYFIIKALKKILRHAIRGYLQLSPPPSDTFQGEEGRIVGIELLPFRSRVYIKLNASHWDVIENHQGDVDTLISGYPWTMAEASLRQGPVLDKFFQGKLHITGDIALGEKVQKALQSMSIDWEEQLSKVTGDVVAHQLCRGLRGASRYVRHGKEAWRDNITEYLQEEVRCFPSALEVNEFLDEVSEMRLQADRLAARIARLETS